MNQHFPFRSIALASLFATSAFAAPGETWQVTTKTEMPNMPYAMPPSVATVCMEKGSKDPRQMVAPDGNCEITDIKTSGNKTSWKMRCDNEGSIMSGSGEVTHGKDSYQGTSRLSGTSDGKAIDMSASYSGKRLGKECDTSAPPVVAVAGMENINDMMGMAKAQMASQMAEQCEVSRYETRELISNRFFGPNAACPGKEKFACKPIRKEVEKKIEVFTALARHDDTSDISISALCGIDLAAATKSICKQVDQNNYQELEEYCPGEAKAIADAARGDSASTSPATPDSVIDKTDSAIGTAKKLKGLLGF